MSQTPEARLHFALSRAPEPLAVAESCTGGLIAERITRLPGASAYFEGGMVVYANRAKTAWLGVDAATIEREGAVSREVALAMAEGLFARGHATLGAAVTGIAGPDGGTEEKPVGTVWIAWGRPGALRCECLHLGGDRDAVRRLAADAVLSRLADLVESGG